MKYLGKSFFLLTLLLLVSRAAAQQSPKIFVALERSFSPYEDISLRLDYARPQVPVQLRLLRSEDVRGFLEGQLSLGRAYEEPGARLNTTHFFSSGLSRVQSPLDLFRRSLDITFRSDFGGDKFENPLRMPESVAMVPSRSQLLIAPPKGFTVVRDLLVDISRDGELAEGIYSFDDEWSGRFFSRTINLKPVPPGLYLVQAIQGAQEGQALLLVSTFSVQVQQSERQLVVRAVDWRGEPLANVHLSYRDEQGKWIEVPEQTGSDGSLLLARPEALPAHLVLQAEYGGVNSFVETSFVSAARSSDSMYVLTDRPIIRPGEHIYFKGILKAQDGGALKVPQGGQLDNVALERSDGSVVLNNVPAKLGEVGAVFGEADLPDDLVPGLHRVIATISGRRYAGELRIQDYVKPTFYLEFQNKDLQLIPGTTVRATVQARRFSGGIPPGTRFEVYLYRQRYQMSQFVQDAGLDLSTGMDYFGEIQSGASLAQPERLFSSVDKRREEGTSEEGEDSWLSAAELDREGKAELEVPIPELAMEDADKDWQYSLMVRAMDADGAFATLQQGSLVSGSDGFVTVRSPKPVFGDADAEIPVILTTQYFSGKYSKGAGKLVLDIRDKSGVSRKEIDFVSDDSGRAELRVSAPSSSAVISARASLHALNDKVFTRDFISEAVDLLSVRGGEGLPYGDKRIRIFPEKTTLKPGESTRLLLVTPQDVRSVWVTVAGQGISRQFATTIAHRAQEAGGSGWTWVDVPPESKLGTGFTYQVSASSSDGQFREAQQGFRVLATEHVLQVEVSPERKIAEPMKNQRVLVRVRNHDGSPQVGTEVAVFAVDRAVYHVQPELRPSLIDFFYPLTRLNLASFYSRELKGYGYGEEILQPNFTLADLKNATKLRPKHIRDTAGFFPQLFTDQNGEVAVTFEMPANLTEWLVTAIAQDREGNFGEGKGLFRTQSDVGIDFILPTALRRGDTVKGILSISNNATVPLQEGFTLKHSSPLVVRAELDSGDLAVSPGDQKRFPLDVTAVGDLNDSALGLAELSLTPAGRANGILSGGVRAVELQVAPAAAQRTWSRSTLTTGPLAFPEGAGEVRSAEVQIMPGLAGVWLQAARSLLSYPYGCTEQLVHSTYPNLAVLKLIRAAELSKEDLTSLGMDDVAVRAEELLKKGVTKLLKHQRADGGFGWYDDSQPSDWRLTLLAGELLSESEEFSATYYRQLSRLRDYLGDVLVSQPTIEPWALIKLVKIGDVKYLQQHVSSLLDTFKHSPAKRSLAESLAVHEILTQAGYLYTNGAREEIEKLKQLALENIASQATQALNQPNISSVFWIEGMHVSSGVVPLFAKSYALLAGHEEWAETSARLERFLVLNAQADDLGRFGWGHTLASGEALKALAPAFSQEEVRNRLFKSEKASLVCGGVPTAMGGGGLLQRTVVTAEQLKTCDSVAGLTRPVLALTRVSASVPFAESKASDQGFDVQRQLLRLRGSDLTPIDSSRELLPGDTIVSKLQVRRSVNGAKLERSNLVVVTDPLPSLVEAVDDPRPFLADAGLEQQAADYWSALKETRHYSDRSEQVLELPIGGEFETYHVWRVRFAGSAVVPPAEAVDMYQASISGHTDGERISVQALSK